MRHLRSTLTTLLLITVPLLALNWVSNLPKPEPTIPDSMKSAGFHGVDGALLEQELSKDSKLKFGGAAAVIACPSTMLVSERVSGLCGYCKVTDVEVYPSWLPEFSMRLDAADFDYRSFYEDFIHRRFFMRTLSFDKPFREKSADGWQESAGRWFTCRDDRELDVNAYIDVKWKQGDVSYEIGPYASLGEIRRQGFVSP